MGILSAFVAVLTLWTPAWGVPCGGGSDGVVESQGRQHVVVLFATFAGSPHAGKAPPGFAGRLFDHELEGSFSHFFREMSGGAFEVEGEVIPKVYASDGPVEDYLAPDPFQKGRYGDFNREVLRKADREVNFGLFDNDGPDGIPNSGDDDGYVDFLFVNVLDAPQEGFLFKRATGIESLGLEEPFVTDDPGGPFGHIIIWKGSTQRVWAFSQAVGVMAHEYGHALGLEDLYDTSFLNRPDQPPEEDGAGIGSWGLMGWGGIGWHGDDGPNSLCAWSLEKLGWVEVVPLERDTTVTFEPVRVSRKVYKIPLTDRQYFLVEYRRARDSYYDRNIPADGLLIWHVDLMGSSGDESHKLVDLECADGLYADKGYPEGRAPDPESGMDNLDFWAHDEAYRAAHMGNRGDATDVFDGVWFREFTAFTNPTPDGYYVEGDRAFQRVSAGIAVRDIRRKGGYMAAEVLVRHWSGPIFGEVVWSGEVRVFGDVWIGPGGSLTILPDTRISFEPADELRDGEDPERIEIRVSGVMKTKERSWYKVPSVAIGREGVEWVGIVMEDGDLDLANVSLKGARCGVRGRGRAGRVRLSWSVFSGNEEAIRIEDWLGTVELLGCSVRGNGEGVYVDAGRVFVEHTASYRNGGAGFVLSADSLLFRSSGAVENGGAGLRIDGTERARVFNATFRDNGKVGLEVLRSVLELSMAEVTGNREGGMRAEDAWISLQGFHIHSNRGFGLRAVRSSGDVREGRFREEEVALWCTASSLHVSQSLFQGNDLAVLCDAGPLPALAFNSFLGNALGMRNTSRKSLDAKNNWWGTLSAGEISAGVEGPVEWNPFLTSDPTGQMGIRLGAGFPNPFSSEASLPFQVPWTVGGGWRVRAVVWDLLGRVVRVLDDRTFPPGRHILRWDGRDDSGRQVASGRYVVEFTLYDPEGYAHSRKWFVLSLIR